MRIPQDIGGIPLTNTRYIGIVKLRPLQDIGVTHGHSREKKEASELKIIKRSGAEVTFDPEKIIIAVTKANESVVPSARMTAV